MRITAQWEPDIVWDDPALRVCLSHSCFSCLSWDCEIHHKSIGAAARAFLHTEWIDVSRIERVTELEHEEGHRMVLLPHSGRVQLRICYTVPVEQRRARVRELARVLSAALS